MSVGQITKWIFPSPTIDSGELDELRRGTVLEISAFIFALLVIIMITSYSKPEELVVAFILLGCSLGSVWLSQFNLRLSISWLILTLIAAIAWQKGLFPDSALQYYFPVVVVVSSLLISSSNVFLVALIANATLLFVARWQGFDWFNTPQVVTPMLITLITACAAWIGSRQIRLTLAWLRNSYANSNTLLEQLREERASLARTIKMLEEAYVRIEKMNHALTEARSVAENARQLKAEFAANISHELRTPLNLIIGFSETMANAPETYTGVTWAPALRGDIQQIYQSSRHLSALIDDILDLSALDAQRLPLTLQEARLEEVIAEAIAVTQDLFRAKKLYLKTRLPQGLPSIRVDTTRLRQVLINLLTNASRFTAAGGITLSAKVQHTELLVAVQDTGIGITLQDVPKVFEEFGQVDGSTTRKHEGTGLGVPLSKRLIESHGGRMWLESQVGLGTTFYFTLPLSAAAPTPASNTPTQAAPLAYRKTLLLHERDPLLLRTLRRHLSGYDIVAVEQLAALSTLIAQHQPLALLANTYGEAAETTLAQVPDDLPVIHFALVGTLRAAQSLGVQDYLIKPVLREQLLESMAGLPQTVHHVLIVDDDPESVELLSRMLQSAGNNLYRPIKVFSGAEALARLRSETIDLVLLDLSMPEVDGMTVLREMRQDERLAATPVIITSAQQPETAESKHPLAIEVTRAQHASLSETLSYLQALIGALPLRGLPGAKS